MHSGQTLKKTGLIIGLILIGLAFLWGRAYYGSARAYHQGEAYLQMGDYIRAVTFFDRSIRWYSPWNPYVTRSAGRLWEIGHLAETEGNTPLALIAVTTLRRGFHAARGIYAPGKNWIIQCDEKIARLEGNNAAGRFHEEADRTADASSGQSPQETAPHILWTLILEFGFLGWLGAMFGFILFACKGGREPKIHTARALVWGSIALICFGVWVIGMWKA
jgi:hypothetical protein